MQYSLTKGLAIVPVKIGISSIARAYYDKNMDLAPEPITVSAWVDTGASVTVIDNSVVQQLRLEAKSIRSVRGFDSNMHASPEAKAYPEYDISFAIMDEPQAHEVMVSDVMQAVGVSLGHPDFQVLLGLDVLRQCTLFMDLAGNNHFDLSPSKPQKDIA
jgi:hypothetical protein